MHYTSIFAFTILFFLSSYADNNVIVKDLKLFVDSTEFFIKAVAYNPVPLGVANMSADGTGGAGYCSVLQTMWSEWKSACYDSDYFSGAMGSPGSPSPSNGWFTNIWARDFPVIKAMGANTLRIYNANPATRAATEMYSNVFLEPYGKNHTLFMDYAQQYGFKVVFPLIGDESLMSASSPSDYKRYLSWQIDEIGNHPALLMFTLGNELPLNSDSSLVAMVNEYIGFARSYMLLKWNRAIPITSAVVDLPNSYDYLAQVLDVDVFTTNAGYRGISFTDLWSGNTVNRGWFELSCQYNKPVFIGEIGWQDMNNDIMSSIPNWFNQIWLDAINHIDQGCIGGTFFEYSDEPMKPALQQTMGVVTLVESVLNGISSFAPFAWNPDTAIIKEIFQYVANGTFNGIPSNFNGDVFAIIGRSPYTLSTLPSTGICAANFSLTSCPTKSSIYDCTGNGICDYSAGACACNVGWSGSDCSVAVCVGSSTCSGSGVCVSTVSPPICNCDAGADGDYCQNLGAASACPIGSGATTACGDGNGICNNSTWTCICHPGWTGLACTIPAAGSSPSQSTTGGTVSQDSSSTGSVSQDSSSTGSVSQESSSTGSVNQASSTGSANQSSGSTGSTQAPSLQDSTSGGPTAPETTTGSPAHNGGSACVSISGLGAFLVAAGLLLL